MTRHISATGKRRNQHQASEGSVLSYLNCHGRTNRATQDNGSLFRKAKLCAHVVQGSLGILIDPSFTRGPATLSVTPVAQEQYIYTSPDERKGVRKSVISVPSIAMKE